MDILEAFRSTVVAIKAWADENKVTKVSGKGLSANDYTNADKEKLNGIENGANKTNIADNLTEENSGKALDAKQGKILNDKIAKVEDDMRQVSSGGIVTDTTLLEEGKPADAAAVGAALAEKQPIGNYLITETDPTVPSWAKASSKPTYTKSEIGLGNVDNIKQYSADNPPPYPVISVNGKTGDVQLDTNKLNNFINDGGRNKSKVAMISFIDDDCRSETYDILFQLIKNWETNENIKAKIPYTVACPAGNIGRTVNGNTYMSQSQLLEMYNYGITVSCHANNEENMGVTYPANTKHGFYSLLSECQNTYKNLGIDDVISYSYCQGVYDDEYIPIVKEFFKMGFTVTDGINEIPYESYYMKRVGLFENDANDDGSDSLTAAKAYVDRVANSGGWLIFMTHAWYKGFNPEKLTELVSYIKSQNVNIVGVNEAINTTGNVIDIGLFKKPLEDSTKSYYVVDSLGTIWTNSIKNKELPINEINVDFKLLSGYLINNGVVTGGYSDKGYKVTEPINVRGCDKVVVSGWAYSGNYVYAFYDSVGKIISGYLSNTSYGQGGDYRDHVVVNVPSDADTIVVAGYLYKSLPFVKKIYHKNHIGIDLELADGKLINSSDSLGPGKITNVSDSSYKVTKSIDVSDCKSIIVTAWAYGGFGLYSFRNKSGITVDCLYSDVSSTYRNADVFNQEIEIPDGATQIVIAGNSNKQLPVLIKVYNDEDNIGDLTQLNTVNKSTIVSAINEIQSDSMDKYSADNPPPYPVTSVNGQTGDIVTSVLPTVTTADNGKVLMVVNGAWAVVDLNLAIDSNGVLSI